MFPDNDGDPHATFWSLAALAFPETRAANLQTPVVSPIHGVSLPPDEKMLVSCLRNSTARLTDFFLNSVTTISTMLVPTTLVPLPPHRTSLTSIEHRDMSGSLITAPRGGSSDGICTGRPKS